VRQVFLVAGHDDGVGGLGAALAQRAVADLL
jgi:hypothetical protein